MSDSVRQDFSESGLRDQPDRITVGTLLDWDYATDLAGNPTAIADLLTPAASRSFAYQRVQHFLTCAAGPWNSPGADCGTLPPAGQPLAWAYDRIGNRLSETRAGASDTYAYAANPCPVPSDPDRSCPLHTPLLTQISLGAGGTRLYQHGPAGHLEQVTAGANVVELGSDAEGRLTALSRPAADVQAEMAYDGRSFLTRSTEFPPNPGGTLFTDGFETGDAGCWSDAVGGASGPGGGACFSLEAASVTPLYSSEGLLHRLARRPSAGGPETLEYHFSLGGRPIAQLSKVGAASTWRFLTADHLGTPVLATDLAGALVWRGGFEPFGADWQAGGGQGASENGIHLRLPGQWVDGSWEGAGEGVGVTYNVHRWYLPDLGVYGRPDPLLAIAPLATYRYALSSPVRFVDWLGLQALPVPTLPPPEVGPPLRLVPPPPPVCKPSFIGVVGTGAVVASAAFTVILTELFSPSHAGGQGISDFTDPSCRPKCGDCDPVEHGFLQAMVKRACKGGPTSCTQGMSPQQLESNFYKNADCYYSRREVNDRCFRGGNEGHQAAAKQAGQAALNCAELLTRPGRGVR